MTNEDASIGVRTWLSGRVPPPPPALAQRLHEIVSDKRLAQPSDLAPWLVVSAERLLRDLGDSREAATDLLAADALLTYAMEAAAEFNEDLDALAAAATLQIASVGMR